MKSLTRVLATLFTIATILLLFKTQFTTAIIVFIAGLLVIALVSRASKHS